MFFRNMEFFAISLKTISKKGFFTLFLLKETPIFTALTKRLMKKTGLLAVLMYPMLLMAQHGTISGKISDSTENKNLPLVVIAFLNATDSTLIGYTRTDNNGNFSKVLPSGKYIVLVTYPTYADFVTSLNFSGGHLDLKNIFLIPKAKLLESIIVTQRSIRIKGDTTEYMADSFKVKPNATVEDLLKELPGIQVDKDGQITAQGQTVQKILVDGDEFFSDDPTIATKNLRADAIKKVQVFDKRSDQSAFTGIDDGNTQKTINLELKDDAKHGYFGKLSAGGLDRYYNAQAMINAFKAKRKLAGFAIASSTSETGLDWSNAGNYGFNSANMSVDAETGSISIYSKSDGDLGSGNFTGTGLPESIKAGLHYSNKWRSDKYNLGSNYLFNNLKVRSRVNDYAQNALNDSLFYTREIAESHSDRTRHNVTAKLEIQLDSSSSLKIDANGYTGIDDYYTNTFAENLSEQNLPVNQSNRVNQSTNTNGMENINILYRKKFKKPGQTFSLNAAQSYSQSKKDGKLFNAASFFDNNSMLLFRDTTDQKKMDNNSNRSISATATYSQPLSKSSFLVFDYSFLWNASEREQLSYDKGLTNKYDVLVDSLSNKFRYNYNTNSAGINYRFVNKKINLSFGGSISNTAFRQVNLAKDTSRKYSYLNFFPRASFTYKFSTYSNVRFNYDGSTRQPTIDQIQPLADNSDPLNILVGNPALKQSFNHSFQLFYTSFQILNERYFYLGGRYSFTQNDIGTSYSIDQSGKRISKYVNTDGNYSANFFGGFNIKIPNSNWRLGTGPVFALYQYSSYVNNLNNITNTTNLSWRFSLNSRKQKVYELFFLAQPSFRSSKSNISKVSTTRYWTGNFSLEGSYQLPWRFEIGSDANIDIRQKTSAFDNNNNVILWNAYLEKRLLKNESLAIRVSMHDILDQAKGYSRYEYSGAVQERHFLTFGQYGLIKVTYNFVNKGGKMPDGLEGGIRL